MFWSLEHMRPTRMSAKSLLAVVLFFGLLWPVCTQSAPQKAYFLGNSFTWDAQPNNISTATTFPNGIEQEIGWSSYSGKSLTYIVANPTDSVKEVALVAYDSYPDPNRTGNFEIDLPGETWDVISMQPHTYGGGLFLDSEIAAAKTVIDTARLNSANACTTFFIFGPWAFQESDDKEKEGRSRRTYSENWLSGYSQNNLNEGILPNVRQAFRGLYWDQVKSGNPEATVNWIPVGEVLYRIDQELQKGSIPGISGAWDLFDEAGVHLADTDSNGIAGRYISHITTLCTIWASAPSSFTTKYDGEIDPLFKTLVDTIAWSTIQEFLPTYAACDIDTASENLIPHPGLTGDLLESSVYEVGVKLSDSNDFLDSATLEYATNFGSDPVLNDPYNISNSYNQDALADASHWTSISYGNNGHSLDIEITLASKENIESVEVFPGRYNLQPKLENGKAYLTLDAPERYIYLVINGNKEQPLFLFIDPLEENPLSEGDDGVLYFGPGIHEIGKDFEIPQDINTVYLALGSYVKGSIYADGRSNISIRGRGILTGDGYGLDTDVNAGVHFKGSGTGQLIEGITSIRPVKYHIISQGTLHTRHVKCFSYNHTSDGIVAGENSLTENSFFKVNDDVIKLYYDNQIVRDIVVYHQTNSPVFEFGWTDQHSKNSLVKRIDIVEDNSVGTTVEGQAILGWAHNSNEGGEQTGHIFEDIRAENGKKRLMQLNIDNATGFVDILCRDWAVKELEDTSDLFTKAPGFIKIAFENVVVTGTHVDADDFENIGNSDLQLSFEPLTQGNIPAITRQPTSSLANPEDNLVLSVEASGEGALNYQWAKNGIPLSGATSASFELRNMVSEAQGVYTVSVSNPFGITQSKAAVISFTKVDQTLDFPSPPDIKLSDAPPSLLAEASSGLDIVYEVVDGPATIVDGQLLITDYGTITIRAFQPGNDLYNPSLNADRTFKAYSPYNWWRFQTLGSDAETGNSASLEDPDKDSLSNLIEYFLGTSPTNYTDQTFFEHVEEEEAIYLQVRQAANSLNGIDVVAEASTDLTNWTNLENDWVEIVASENGDRLYKLKTGDWPSQTFIRLRLETL